MEQSVENQEELLNVQKESLSVQEKLLKHGHDLEKIIETIVTSIDYSQQTILGVQNWLISEMAWFDSILFYVISLFFVFIFTSFRNTKSCRLPLFMLLLVGILSERFCCKLFLAFSSEDNTNNLHVLLMKLIWFLRYTLVALCIITVLFAIYGYKDYQKINNRLLQEIQLQNIELAKLLEIKRKQDVNVVDEKLPNLSPVQRENKGLQCLPVNNGDIGKSLRTYNLRTKARTPNII